MVLKYLYSHSKPVFSWVPYKKPAFWVIFVAILLPFIIPVIHMIIFSSLWKQYNRVVDKKNCYCSCWDTVFKGMIFKVCGRFLAIYRVIYSFQETMKLV